MTITATAFTAEVTQRFEFLTVGHRFDSRAFTGPDLQFGTDSGTIGSVSYRQGPLTMQLRLVAADSNARYVDLVGLVDFGDHAVETPIAHEDATTERQMRRAVKQLATRTRATML